MAEPLKNVYNQQFFNSLLNSWHTINPSIDRVQFIKEVTAADWDQLELKARMSKIAESMKLYLPSKFDAAALQLQELTAQLIKDGVSKDNFEYMFIPEFIEKNGINDLETALNTMEVITQFTSCEFAIRSFIVKYEKETMKQLLNWSTHTHESVRRLSSEGCRPRLPWAMVLPTFKKDPSLLLPILENLKNDTSLYVRKSVANNLNDISKDHPELVLKLVKKWKGKSDHTDWIIKHACRTLLKEGHPESMRLFGYATIEEFELTNFKLNSKVIPFGDQLEFKFQLKNIAKKEILMRLEYGIYFLKANGTQNRKVFKISERTLKVGEQIKIEKHHSIKPISTRKYYGGSHAVVLILNGIEQTNEHFELKV